MLQSPTTFPTVQELNNYSHVLVLQASATERYGEYTYTGGSFGSTILFASIETANAQTLFAFPAGYRVCASALLGVLPCV